MDLSKQERTDLELADLSSAVEVLSRKWHPLILHILNNNEEAGFNEIKNQLNGVSGKVLSNSLKDLEERKVINKKVINESPRRVKYSITNKGKELKPVLEELIDWNEKHAQKHHKILAVDDEQKLADIYQQWLQPNYEVNIAYNGEQALEEINNKTDLVLLDRMMPDMSGKQVLKKIRKQYKDLQIVMITAKDPEIEVANLEIDDYMVKPVDKEDLQEKVGEILGRKQEEKSLKALKARKKILNQKFSEEELEKTKPYQKLKQKIQEKS